MRDHNYGHVGTPPKRFTSPTWDPPPPRKQDPQRSIPAVLV